jgi:hypothetical protein
MAINKLYISHKQYKFDNQCSMLINNKNCQEVIDSDIVNNYHTSINDLTEEYIPLIIRNSKEIILIDINCTDLTYSIGRLLHEITNANVSVKFENCKNFDALAINKLTQTRSSIKPVLWVAGCSISFGIGVSNYQRYGRLLSDNLNLPEVLLAKPGTSILYSADQLLRSDIRSNDIVVWGLTNIPRIEIFNVDTVNFVPINISSYRLIDKSLQYWNLDYFASPTQCLLHIRMIFQVINFCKKIGARLYLANMLDTTWTSVVFKEYNNFINFVKEIDKCSPKFLDLGTDNQHPGPKQHQYYAEQIFNIIKEKNYGKTI